MAESYSDRIRAYCEAQGIEIPPGFARRAASRYAAIDLGCQPPRLVATTWFRQEDMRYYAERLAVGKTLRFVDFRDGREISPAARRAGAGDRGGTDHEDPARAPAAPPSPSASPSPAARPPTELSPDTARLVERLFGAGDRAEATRLLAERCGNGLPFLEGLDPAGLERYRFAALKSSGGDLDALRRAVALAERDWRDLIVAAAFANDPNAHAHWRKAMLDG